METSPRLSRRTAHGWPPRFAAYVSAQGRPERGDHRDSANGLVGGADRSCDSEPWTDPESKSEPEPDSESVSDSEPERVPESETEAESKSPMEASMRDAQSAYG